MENKTLHLKTIDSAGKHKLDINDKEGMIENTKNVKRLKLDWIENMKAKSRLNSPVSQLSEMFNLIKTIDWRIWWQMSMFDYNNMH